MSVESKVLLACATVVTNPEDETAIREMLDSGLDWTRFAREAVESGLASPVAWALVRIASDLVPEDILEVLRQIIERTRTENSKVLNMVSARIDVVRPETQARAIRGAWIAADRALAVNPNDASAWHNLGAAFASVRRFGEAIACYDRAIALDPRYAPGWRDRAIATSANGDKELALSYINHALALDPQDTRAWTNRAHLLARLQCIPEALEASDRALAIDPENTSAARVGIHAALFSCDWTRREQIMQRIEESLRKGQPVITPFNHLAVSNSEAKNLTVAKIWARAVPPSTKPLWSGERYHHAKIRLAYVSTDFCDGLSVNAIASCFTRHNKMRFETIGVSLKPSDGSDTRRRIEAGFDRFIDAQSLSAAQIAAMLRETEVDIAVDLNGYAGDKRTEIFARRPAPLQVNYLGYAGTMGMSFFDYIVADRIVIPAENQFHYTEKVVYLPDTFFPGDNHRQVAEYTPSRKEAGLPETGFVFACHNTAYKIAPETFDIWMRVLRTVENSVLWLGATDDLVMSNLRREAENRGIQPTRLIFAPRVAQRADHLARLRLADLFLDTLPYNGHTTASDALYVGVPVLTLIGTTFPARIAASLLHAVGLPELIAFSEEAYEQHAVALAEDPVKFAAIKAKLMRNRNTEPLFDSIRFTHHLEAAFTRMWERHQAGLPPAGFSISN